MMSVVLFACVHNAGRSQMAAAWFNALAEPSTARALSAGTEPAPRVHPEVVVVMREVGIDLSDRQPQKLTRDLARGVHLLVTMGCGDECPVVPGLRRDDWPLEDPQGRPLARVREIRDEVRGRVIALLRQESWGRGMIREAKAEDRESVEALLVESGLPTDGVAEHFGSFFVAEEGARIVGAVGLEWYGQDALLRSVVVANEARGTGLGVSLARRAIDAAHGRGVRALYLLTTTAETFFPRLGFVRVSREELPDGVRASRELNGVCPASATLMRRAF